MRRVGKPFAAREMTGNANDFVRCSSLRSDTILEEIASNEPGGVANRRSGDLSLARSVDDVRHVPRSAVRRLVVHKLTKVGFEPEWNSEVTHFLFRRPEEAGTKAQDWRTRQERLVCGRSQKVGFTVTGDELPI
jgi:hypothetical protein